MGAVQVPDDCLQFRLTNINRVMCLVTVFATTNVPSFMSESQELISNKGYTKYWILSYQQVCLLSIRKIKGDILVQLLLGWQ